jgi:glycosyltransferase involved in cell wall biosynthesis
LQFDIGIAPLETTEFTDSKSNIKWQEYSLMGIPTIASDTGPYQDSIKHASTGYLVKNTMDDWYKAFKLLIENESLRRKIGEKAKEEVINNWSLEKNWHKIKDGLEQLNSLDIKD